MENFSLFIPTKLYFGRGSFNKALLAVLKDSGKRILVVTGKSMLKNGYIERIKKCFKLANRENDAFFYQNVTSNPKVHEVADCVAYGKKMNVSAVIGMGGGSIIDAAKVAAAGIGCGCSVKELFEGMAEVTSSTLPIIAIPSTAGTGSELSKAAILTDTRRNMKTGIRSKYLFPKTAIVDAELTYSLPARETMETGFDVIAHAIESYVSIQANSFSEMLSQKALKLAVENLIRLSENLNDIKAREKMSYASMLMGINLGNVGTALPHRLQYPIGAYSDTSHGAGLAALYPAWIYYSYQYSADKFNEIGTIISGAECKNIDDVSNAIERFLRKIDISYRLSDLGIKVNQCNEFAEKVTGNIKNDPASADKTIIEKIYKKSI